jgi:hypothetical protein
MRPHITAMLQVFHQRYGDCIFHMLLYL